MLVERTFCRIEHGSMIKRILKRNIGTVKKKEFEFALEQLRRNKLQVDLDYINDLEQLKTSIMFYRNRRGFV